MAQNFVLTQEENFTRAAEFIPERWIDGECSPGWNRESSLVLPFGFGKRACPGKRLAEVELYIMTAKLFHAFDVALVDDLQVPASAFSTFSNKFSSTFSNIFFQMFGQIFIQVFVQGFIEVFEQIFIEVFEQIFIEVFEQIFIEDFEQIFIEVFDQILSKFSDKPSK
jgi:hypothetical protein